MSWGMVVTSDDMDRDLEERVRRAYRETPLEPSQARARLAQRLRAEPPPRRRRWNPSWWLEPRAFAWRPASVTAAALVLLIGGALIGRVIERRSTAGAIARHDRTARDGSAAARAAALAGGTTRVVFALSVPGARRVSVAGDFNGWDPEATPLRRAALGDLWTAEVALPEGLHVYAFVVDGDRWLSDPSAPLAPRTVFGARNSVVLVGRSGPS